MDDPRWQGRAIRPQWLAFPDLIQAYRLALTVPDIGFEIITVVGESSRRRWDLERARKVLGYRPAIRLEDRGYRHRARTVLSYGVPSIVLLAHAR